MGVGRPARPDGVRRVSIAHVPLAASIDGPARATFERGRAFYYMRHGQMNSRARIATIRAGASGSRRDDQPGSRHGISRLSSRVAGTGIAAAKAAGVPLRHSRRHAAAGRAGAHRSRALSRMARAGAADRGARRAPLARRGATAARCEAGDARDAVDSPLPRRSRDRNATAVDASRSRRWRRRFACRRPRTLTSSARVRSRAASFASRRAELTTVVHAAHRARVQRDSRARRRRKARGHRESADRRRRRQGAARRRCRSSPPGAIA